MEPCKDDDKRIELFYVQTSEFLKKKQSGRKKISYFTICTPFFDVVDLIELKSIPAFDNCFRSAPNEGII